MYLSSQLFLSEFMEIFSKHFQKHVFLASILCFILCILHIFSLFLLTGIIIPFLVIRKLRLSLTVLGVKSDPGKPTADPPALAWPALSSIRPQAWQQFLASQGLNSEEGTSFHSFLSLPQFEKTGSGTPGRGEAQRKQQTSDLQFMTSYTNIYYIKIFKIKSNERIVRFIFVQKGSIRMINQEATS